MRPSEQLGKLIADHMSAPGSVIDGKPESEFVLSGLRAAIFANPIARKKILADVANVLECDPGDLEFLFMDLNSNLGTENIFDMSVPDYRKPLLAVGK